MKVVINSLKLLVLLIGINSLLACSSSDTANVNTISGVASKGPISGGHVEVFSLLSDGTKSTLLKTATTGTDGSFNAGVGNYSGAVLVEVSGGTYIDEATGLEVSNTLMRAAIPSVSGQISVTVTPLTELAVAYAESNGGLTADNITTSNTFVSNLFGGVDIIATEPVDVLTTPKNNATQDEIDYGLMLAAISQMVSNDAGITDVNQLMGLLLADLADGTLDENAAALITALTDFVNSVNNATAVTTLDNMTIDDVIATQAIPEYPLMTGAPVFSVAEVSVEAGVTVDITVPVSPNANAIKVHGLCLQPGVCVASPVVVLTAGIASVNVTFPLDAFVGVITSNFDLYPVISIYDANCTTSQDPISGALLVDAPSGTCKYTDYYFASVVTADFYTAGYGDAPTGGYNEQATDLTVPLVSLQVPCTTCKIFVSVNQGSGDLLTAGQAIDAGISTGIEATDVLCMADPSYPGTGNYKALIVDGTNRIASVSANAGDGQIDWVLRANTGYYRMDGSTIIMTTNANGILLSDLTNTINATATGHYTGLNFDWTTGAAYTCSSWTSTVGTPIYGYTSGVALSDVISSEALSCNYEGVNMNTLLCVEQ